MYQSFRPLLMAALLSLSVSTACQKVPVEPDNQAETTLVGRWHLTGRQCYCPASPTPNEQVTFGGRQVIFYKNGQVARTGEYTVTVAASACLSGSGTTAPALHFTFSAGGAGLNEPQFTLTGNTLTLDYGGPCDAPVDTYQRLP